MSSNVEQTADRETAPAQTARLVVSWLIVGAPLAWGVYQTISKTLPLFGG